MKARASKTGWVGVDLGVASVKVAQVVRTDAGPRLRAAAVVRRSRRWTSAALADAPPQSSLDELAAAASLCDQLAGASAAAMLPGALCEVTALEAAAVKRPGGPAELLRAVEAETQRTFRDYLVDSWPAPLQAGKLHVVAAPRPWSDQLAADVHRAGYRCRAIDALPWALARAASLLPGAATPLAALDWAYGKATICLVHQGAPALLRTLKDCAYQNVLDAIARGLRLDERDAETVLQKHGLDPAASADVVEDLLQQPLARLTFELRRTLDYWRGVTRGRQPETIYLFGGGGTLSGIGPWLSQQLGVHVAPWSLPPEDHADATQLPPGPLVGAAAGLSALAWEAS